MPVQLLQPHTENLYSSDNSIIAIASCWHLVADTPDPDSTDDAEAHSEFDMINWANIHSFPTEAPSGS